MFFEEFPDLVRMLDGDRDSILFTHFGGLDDNMPPIFSFLCLCYELIFSYGSMAE